MESQAEPDKEMDDRKRPKKKRVIFACIFELEPIRGL
jgi:hypothetical protein